MRSFFCIEISRILVQLLLIACLMAQGCLRAYGVYKFGGAHIAVLIQVEGPYLLF